MSFYWRKIREREFFRDVFRIYCFFCGGGSFVFLIEMYILSRDVWFLFKWV